MNGSEFWSRVLVRGEDECWPFVGAKSYGNFYFEGKTHHAHRVAFFLANGYWPEVVMHSCDNPPCCNPKHLVAGDQKLNIADRCAKGRTVAPGHGPLGGKYQ